VDDMTRLELGRAAMLWGSGTAEIAGYNRKAQ